LPNKCVSEVIGVDIQRARAQYLSHVGQGHVMLERTLLALQAFQVALLWTHDWIPLERLNDVAAVRKQDSLRRLVTVTLIQSVPYSLGLAFSAWYLGAKLPGWVLDWLWISYGLLFLGELRAWWIPYLFGTAPERIARYQAMFGNTHAFLPKRKGIVPNTLHFFLHVATASTLIVLLFV
jgi:hypothetical protein